MSKGKHNKIDFIKQRAIQYVRPSSDFLRAYVCDCLCEKKVTHTNKGSKKIKFSVMTVAKADTWSQQRAPA